MGSRKLDINKATVEEFAQLAGIGQVKAEAIVRMRNKLGKFCGISDLQKVTGIGPGLVDQHRTFLICKETKNGKQLRMKNRALSTATGKDSHETSVKQKHVEPATGADHLSRPSTSNSRPYNTRSCTLSQENTFKKDLPKLTKSKRILRPKSTVSTRSEPMILRSRQLQWHSHRLLPSEATEEAPCSSGTENSTVNTESCSSEQTNDGGCSANILECMPSCSNDSNVFQIAQNFDDKIHTNKALLSKDSLGTSALRSSSLDDETGDGGCMATVSCLLSSDISRQQSNGLQDNDSGISVESKIPVSCESLKKLLQNKRKCVRAGYAGDVKKPCLVEDGGFESLCGDEIGEEPQVGSSSTESQQTLLRKQKIPSKKNPPPLLVQWLKTFQNWTHAARLLALDELMEICDPTEVRHVMQVIEPQFQRDFISLLPKELALYVLSFLEPKDLLRAAQTCRYWHMLAEDNILWREKCHEEGISESLVFANNVRRKRPYPKSPWKYLYLRQQQIEKNWRTSTRAPKVLKGHDDHVITCLEFNGTKIVSGSDDNTLKVWSAVTGKCLRTLTGHTGGVWSSQMSGNIIVSGSTDRTLKVWDADTGRTIHTLYGHTSTVRCMHLYKNRVVSGSRDSTLRMWDIETGHCHHVLIGHMAAVRCVQYDGRRVVSGAYDYMVKIWDPERETCLQTLAGHTNRVYSLQFDGIHIVSGSLDTSIRVWSAETGTCLHILVGHQSLTSGMELKDNILVSGNADSTVKVWNITTGQCLQTLNGPNKHQSAVTCLQFNRKLIITSSDDGTIKIWDLKTGEFIRNLVTLESGGSGGVVWRIRCNNSKLVCAVGSRNGTEETKLLVLDFDVEDDNSSTGRPAIPTPS